MTLENRFTGGNIDTLVDPKMVNRVCYAQVSIEGYVRPDHDFDSHGRRYSKRLERSMQVVFNSRNGLGEGGERIEFTADEGKEEDPNTAGRMALYVDWDNDLRVLGLLDEALGERALYLAHTNLIYGNEIVKKIDDFFGKVVDVVDDECMNKEETHELNVIIGFGDLYRLKDAKEV
ncbi:MAG: hypothetical protein AABY26_00045 [Nanoarchaeota archaeon]